MTLDGKNSLFRRKDAFLEPTAQIWIKIDPYKLRQKCSPIFLVSGNLGLMGIFAGVPLGGGLRWEWGGRRRQFLAIWTATSSESSEIRPAILYDDMITLVGRQMTVKKEWPWMTLSRYLPWKSLFGKHSVAAKRRLLEPIAQIRIKIDPYNLRQKCSPMSLVSDIWGLWGSSRGFLLAGGRRRLYSAI